MNKIKQSIFSVILLFSITCMAYGQSRGDWKYGMNQTTESKFGPVSLRNSEGTLMAKNTLSKKRSFTSMNIATQIIETKDIDYSNQQQYGNTIMESKNKQKMNPTFFNTDTNEPNKRLMYSSLWAFASLNYLYADLVGLMDANMLNQYLTGTVNDIEITPEFLTMAGVFMQIPLANVFLPHVIKNDHTLRWVQIASGAVMTLVQSATLFVGKPAAYYVLFSGIEIATTTFITIDALRWKTKRKSRKI